MRPWFKRTLLLVVGVPLLLVVGLVLFLSFGDLSGMCGIAERAASDALGRQLRVAGRCEPELWSPARLVVEDVALAGPDWGSGPEMVVVDRLSLSLDLWSVLRRPIRIYDLEIRGARVSLERDANGRASWDLALGGEEDPEAPPVGEPGVPLIAEHLSLADVEVDYRDAVAGSHYVLRVDRLRLDLAADDRMRLDAVAALNDLAIELSGSVGTQAELLRAGAVSARLEASVAKTDVTLDASFADLASLADPRIEVGLEGEEIAEVTEILGTPSLGSGPFRAAAELRGESLTTESEVVVEAHLGDVEATARGRLRSLLDPQGADLEVDASGPDLAAVGALLGTEVLPPAPFALSGAVAWDERRLTVDGLRARLGESSLTADGELALGGAEEELAMDLAFEGPDLSAVARLPDLDLPAAPFRGAARFVGGRSGSVVESLRLVVGETTVEASGALGTLPGLEGTALDVDLVSEDLPLFDSLAGFELPRESARLTGRVAYPGESIDVAGLEAALGEHTLAADGSIGLAAGFEGTDLELAAEGPDLAALAGWLPVESPALPSVAYTLEGRLVLDGGGYRLEGVEARGGELRVSATGRVGPLPTLEGTDVELAASGPRLADLEAWAEFPTLPAEAFSVEGRVRSSGGVYQVSNGAASLGEERLTLEGSVGPFPDLLSTDACVETHGPEVGRLRDYLVGSGLVEEGSVPELPFEAWAVSGCVRVVETGYDVRGGRVRLGEIEGVLDGIVSAHPTLVGSDVTLTVRGPDAVALGEMVGLELPLEPFEIDGRIERTDSGYRAVTLRAALGDMRLTADGLVGSPPKLEGTDVKLHFAGERTRLLAELIDVQLPKIAFDVAATVRGSTSRVSIEGLEAQLGGSDLHGTVRADLRDRPKIDVDLRSELLDIGRLLRPLVDDEPTIEASEVTVAEQPGTGAGGGSAGAEPEAVSGSGLLIPDDPLTFDTLRSLDASVRYEADLVRGTVDEIHDVVLAAELRDGALRLLPTSITGPTGSQLSARLTLLPVEGGYDLEARISADGLELLGAFTDGVKQAPTVDVDLDLNGAGPTPHALVSAADGVVIVTVNPGYIEGRALDLLGGDLLTQMLGAVNPFSKEDDSEIECVVALGELTDGVMTLDPVILRTTRMDFVGDGRIDFETEEFDLGWTIKNRKGLGLSLGMFTDSSFQLGGTLADPRLEITPLEFAVERTKTVATAGAWPALKSLWNRVTAGRDRCGLALEEAQEVRRAFRREQAAAAGGARGR